MFSLSKAIRTVLVIVAFAVLLELSNPPKSSRGEREGKSGVERERKKGATGEKPTLEERLVALEVKMDRILALQAELDELLASRPTWRNRGPLY